eukprot:gb/GECG01014235.1/.p1 GENE.gb/GECG01014235.1/~~gb/GECG01014235.1/.p1  ORF type:complete len:113 (+),score=6.12 gb/GECG01014235.1/:1-339(+)
MPFFSRSLLTSCTTLMLVTACISSLMVSTSNALKEETLSAIKQLNDPLVVLFHDGTNSEDYENALDVMKETERVRKWHCLVPSLAVARSRGLYYATLYCYSRDNDIGNNCRE